ncbi:MAG: outer membrane lipoprotein-sorting protein [Rhodobiaceae bacterium]|nr:outer membrane lipoprotein-sorting protein [Rhodobiaceae bacterium]
MKKMTALVSMVAVSAFATAAMAAVPAEQANRLGADLTPVGAEKAGSGDIPAWTGGLPTVPSNVSYTPGDKLPNPFASDAIKYTVTAGNMGQYDAILSDGYKAMLTTYPSYKMNVYPSRRSCAFPDNVYAATRSNATIGELVGGGNGVGKAIMGFPFPIPNSALEIIWNHSLRFRSFKLTRQFTAAAVTRSGDYQLTTVQDEAILQWSDPSKGAAEDLNNISLYYIANTVAPARSAGSVILVHETLDRSLEPRKAWQYSPGTRRVRRAPNISYDNPGTNSDGLSTSDAFDGYNGAPDRYDWTVLGKQERLIAFNNYDAEAAPYAEFITPLHLNQDKIRYELARAWVIEAKLKPGNRHVYGRRVKAINEDNWTISESDLYDGRGELWRVQELQQLQRYNVPLCGSAAEVVYDLQAGRYLSLAMTNEEPQINYFADELDANRYTPASIRQLGVR